MLATHSEKCSAKLQLLAPQESDLDSGKCGGY